MIQNFESKIFFPKEFKQELLDYLEGKNPKEDNKKFLNQELKTNQVEEKTQPNTLLIMQEAKNAPWGVENQMTRTQYV